MEKTVLSANTILQGRYRVIQLLGHGGMGAVYEAMDENLRCRVTVKETFATGAEKDVRRAFAREAQLLANIRHPAIPKVSDYFEQGDGLFFVMEFVPGLNLEEGLKLRGRPFPLSDVLAWADALLAALSELHSADPPIVHKDIKPSNLKCSPKGEIFLLDFGLAKGALGQMSTVGRQDYSNLQGHTPHFAPPEQIARTGTTPRSDLYSLGATLWRLLTNRLPDDASRRNYYIYNNEPDPVRPAHEFNPEVPRAVSAVLEQAMELAMTKRPSDAEEMREALREAVEAPVRAAAERARREAEERTRREAQEAGRLAAEAGFARRLEEERAALAAEVGRLKQDLGRLKEEHASALASAQEEVSRARKEAARELDAERKRLGRVEAALGELAWSAAEMDERLAELDRQAAALKKERDDAQRVLDSDRERARRAEAARELTGAALREKEATLSKVSGRVRELESEVAQFAEKARGYEPLLKERQLARQTAERERDAARTEVASVQGKLTVTEKQRDKALLAAKSAKAQLARAESDRARRQQRLLGAGAVVCAVLSLGILSYLAYPTLANLLSPGPPSVKVSDDRLSVALGDVKLETVEIPGGSFMMGAADAEATRPNDQKPQHQVTVQDFQIGKYEVTQAQWRMVAKLPKVNIELTEEPSYFKGDDLPVEDVTWDEAVEFCARLSKATGIKFRLPTEAEWEYAARGGTSSASNLDAVAWNADNSGKRPLDALQVLAATNNNSDDYKAKLIDNGCQPHPVGQKGANGFGLYDTLGNVLEWCADTWHPDYKGAPNDGAAWSAGGDAKLRACRGGSWFYTAKYIYPGARYSYEYNKRYMSVGFRVAAGP